MHNSSSISKVSDKIIYLLRITWEKPLVFNKDFFFLIERFLVLNFGCHKIQHSLSILGEVSLEWGYIRIEADI